MVLQRLAIGTRRSHAIYRSQSRQISIKNNPYKVKRPWPPDYASLPQNYQLRLERRFRRRSKLKWARPRMMKVLDVVQYVSISCASTYELVTLCCVLRSRSCHCLWSTFHGSQRATR